MALRVEIIAIWHYCIYKTPALICTTGPRGRIILFLITVMFYCDFYWSSWRVVQWVRSFITLFSTFYYYYLLILTTVCCFLRPSTTIYLLYYVLLLFNTIYHFYCYLLPFATIYYYLLYLVIHCYYLLAVFCFYYL